MGSYNIFAVWVDLVAWFVLFPLALVGALLLAKRLIQRRRKRRWLEELGFDPDEVWRL